MVNLTELEKGEWAVVTSVFIVERRLRNSMYATGFTPGVLVRLLHKDKKDRIFHCQIRGGTVVMRANEAKNIAIRKVFVDMEQNASTRFGKQCSYSEPLFSNKEKIEKIKVSTQIVNIG